MSADPLRRARRRSPHVPVRTCVGCRSREDRSALLRVVARARQDGSLVLHPDERQRLPGRGAWLHPTTECLELAVRRHAFGRALRAGTGPDVGPLRTWLEAGTSVPSTDKPSAQTGSSGDSGNRKRV